MDLDSPASADSRLDYDNTPQEEEMNEEDVGQGSDDVAQVEHKKDKTLSEFLEMMDKYEPVIPDAVTDYYLARSGCECNDVKLKRLLAFAAQKFITDITQDAYQFCKLKQQGLSVKEKKYNEKKPTLTLEGLSSALEEYGINVKRPEYYA